MHILKVEAKDVRFSKDTGRFRATLLVEGADKRMSLETTTCQSAKAQHRDVLNGLVADALRQMRRLPEYRGSSAKITFAQGALRV